jgi:hypothetical protein
MKQSSFFANKKLSAKEMKQIQGAAGTITVWVCLLGDCPCFRSQSTCQANCADPTKCKSFGGCI